MGGVCMYEQFKAIGRISMDKWTADGEQEYVAWFEETYFTAPWDTWFGGAAGDVAGIFPSQNPIEAFHRAIKTSAVSTLRASTATALNSTLPRIVRLAGLEWSGVEAQLAVIPHYGISPIPAEMFASARAVIMHKENYMRMCKPETKVIRTVVFNLS